MSTQGAARSLPQEKELPDEIQTLKGQVRDLSAQLSFAWLCYAQLDYTHRDLLRRVYGARSQKLKNVLKNAAAGQGEAACAPVPAEDSAPATHTDAPKKPRKHGGGGRREPPANLPIVREEIDLPEAQKAGLVKIREEITTQLGYRPSLFYLHQIVRFVYASPTREHAPKVAALPPQVIPQAGVSVSFIVHCIIAKYLDHIPYYRQVLIDGRGGVLVPRQARYRYAMAGANLLMSIRDGLKQMILSSCYMQIDETFADMIDPDREGRTRKAYLWGYLAPKEKACVLEFSINRSGDILDEFFEAHPHWAGAIQSDGARMYTRFIKKRPGIRHHQCLQHLRKHLVEALQANERNALPLLEEIARLYAIEDQANERMLSDRQRGYLRHALAKPILKRLQKRFLELKNSPTLFGNLRKAVLYGTRRWRALALYAKVDHGHILIDSNRIEGIFRPTKVGLRSFLFIGHPAAGWVSAVLYSIMATCRLLKVNAEEYLNWVLPKLAALAQSKVKEAWLGLLPHDFARLQSAAATASAADMTPVVAQLSAAQQLALPAPATSHSANSHNSS